MDKGTFHLTVYIPQLNVHKIINIFSKYVLSLEIKYYKNRPLA